MDTSFHIIGGDVAARSLRELKLAGDVLVWHDVLYAEVRPPGWPSLEDLAKRASFLERVTAGGLTHAFILQSLQAQYQRLSDCSAQSEILLWFDGCLFDQSMLAHLLTCLAARGLFKLELICVNSFPGIEPFDGLGQLSPEQLGSLLPLRKAITQRQLDFAHEVDAAFAAQDFLRIESLAALSDAPLEHVPAAAARWVAEQPDKAGLRKLERLALAALANGCKNPSEIFAHVALHDTHPIYWGDITLWAALNDMAERNPRLVRINGPKARLPQWENEAIDEYEVLLTSAGSEIFS